MIKILGVVPLCMMLVSCASIPENSTQVQLINNDNPMINSCAKLGLINTDTRGNPFNFNSVAEGEFKSVALEKYKADSAVVTSRRELSAGRIVLQGTALKCYP